MEYYPESEEQQDEKMNDEEYRVRNYPSRQEARRERAITFLTNGFQVKVSVRFRGREITHAKIGEELLANFCQEVSHLVNSKTDAIFQGRVLSILLKP